MSLLEVTGLNSYYGDSHILFDVAMRIEANEVVALLGRNGAGKSTTLKSLMGIVTPRSGSIKFDGTEIAGRASHAIALAGMQLVPEDRRIFGSLNVEENIILAGLTAPKRWPLGRIYEMFPRLRDLVAPPTGNVDAVELDAAAARRHHAHQTLQRRALAGTVAAEQSHHLVTLDMHGDVEQDMGIAVIAVQAVDLDQAHAAISPCTPPR